MTSAGFNIADLKDLVQQDIQASHELQTRIDELRARIAEGKTITDANAISDLESKGRKMLKDLIVRIDKIEDQPSLTATDREMLQALNARQVVCDKQVMQIAEFRDLHWEARGRDYHEENPEYVAAEKRSAPGVKVRESRKQPVAVAEGLGESLPKSAHPPVDEPKNAFGPSVESVAEAVDLGDLGAAHHAATPPSHDAQSSPNAGLVEVVYEDDEEEYEDDEEAYEEEDMIDEESDDEEPDKSKWPLCYQILDVDPDTDPHYSDDVCQRYTVSCHSQYLSLSPALTCYQSLPEPFAEA